ncbi:beta-1,4-N-acetylgalactosaminyltransferase bre-4 isoform X1 [Stomoxys calcitrans]|uniref:beta-1,4-N-acetylgalactosaminyltransferase bre-4 isoform X1 n=1 Tax=Stomoxys calcitrans TaxID=35570 RepID=UPI0027E225B6|nr:beta-1,4-N-acetylgalactosaminyltransferase bre-4 isoform X1 [Stomoxys calcitrans]
MTSKKITLLRYLFCGVCMLLALNLLIDYFADKTEVSSSFSRLSLRKIYKYNGTVLSSTGSSSSNNISSSSNNNINSNNSLASLAASLLPMTNDSSSSTFDNSSKHNQQLELHGNSSGDSLVGNNSKNTTELPLPICQDPVIEESSPFVPNITLESLDVINDQLGLLLEPGGAFKPKDCIARHHVAIVVPFRDRYAHLSIFLRNIHKFLMQQRIAYRIFIIEQTNGKPFNRAALMNIGFLEAMKLFKWDCFIFHDVDLLPLDNRNLYNCPRQPRHMSVAIDKFNYKLPYRTIFGGVSAMTRQHFLAVNGFSNSYFGWGGEDDDMSNRLRNANLFIARYPINIARYTMLKHQKEKANPKRYENLVNGINKSSMDGLNSIKYDIYSYKSYPTFSWFYAELKISEQKIKIIISLDLFHPANIWRNSLLPFYGFDIRYIYF